MNYGVPKRRQLFTLNMTSHPRRIESYSTQTQKTSYLARLPVTVLGTFLNWLTWTEENNAMSQ
jgi:hypothetical protein